MQSDGCDAEVSFVCFFVHFKYSPYLPGKVRIGVARPIPLPDDDEEYEESPPDTARYNGESLLQHNTQYQMKELLNSFD